MSIKSVVVALLAASSLAPAFADESHVRQGTSRAEVLADLQIYRTSGLAELERHDTVDWTSQRYEEARLAYERLRAEPGFQRFVQAIAQQRGEAPVSMAVNDASVHMQ